MYQLSFSDIKKSLKEYKSDFSLDVKNVSADDSNAFLLDSAKKNLVPAQAILCMLFVMEAIMTLLYVLNTYFAHYGSFFPYYIWLYTSMLIFSAAFSFFLHIFRENLKILMRIELGLILLLNLWSAIFSALDVANGFSSYLFIQFMMIHSLIFRVNPTAHCAANAAGYLLYTLIILNAHLSLTDTFAELVNPFFMVAAACVLIVISHYTKFKSFLSQKLIQEQHKQLEFYANNDFLAKIPNRKSIIEYLLQVLEENRSPITCMMIDIDNFKLYNDTYGHIAGDSCIIQLSGAMCEYVKRQGGKLGRYGGEEFLAVFENKTSNQVCSISGDLVQLVRDLQIPFSSSPIEPIVTISIGIHTGNSKDGKDIQSILTHTDRALYTAKGQGKNRFIIVS